MATVVYKTLPDSEMAKQAGFADMKVQTEPGQSDETTDLPWPVPELVALRSKQPPEPVNTMDQLAAKLTQASIRTLEDRRIRYRNVEVLLLQWKEPQYEEMQQNADDIGSVFRDDYNFNVTPVPLSCSKRSVKAEFTYALSKAVIGLNEQPEYGLLIIYYCGHGEYDHDYDRTCLRAHRNNSVALDWVWAQEQLQELVGCDLLLLFDCCHATAMLRDGSEWDRRCEILGATDALDSALADRDHSFTQALISQLKLHNDKGAYVCKIARALTNSRIMTELSLEKAPDYRPHTDENKHLGNIYLEPLREPGHEQHVGSFAQNPSMTQEKLFHNIKAETDAVMLVAVRLSKTAGIPHEDEWKGTIRQAPHNALSMEFTALTPAEYDAVSAVLDLVKVQGAYKGSCLLMVSMPVWLWFCLEHSPSYHPVGVVHSDNLWGRTSAPGPWPPHIEVDEERAKPSEARTENLARQGSLVLASYPTTTPETLSLEISKLGELSIALPPILSPISDVNQGEARPKIVEGEEPRRQQDETLSPASITHTGRQRQDLSGQTPLPAEQGRNPTPENVAMLQAFEWFLPDDQQHWKRLRDALLILKNVGVDNIWIPPACKASRQSSNGYDPYDLYDLGQFDQQGGVATKWGTKQELVDLCNDAHELGIGIYFHAVLDHKAGADRTERCPVVEVHPDKRSREISDTTEIDAWLGFDFPGRGDKYSSLRYHWYHFTVTNYDQSSGKVGSYWVQSGSKDSIKDMDIEPSGYEEYYRYSELDLDHPEVAEDIKNWGLHVSGELKLKGMCFDAIENMPNAFLPDFIRHLEEHKNPGWFFVSQLRSKSRAAMVEYIHMWGNKVNLFDEHLAQNFAYISATEGADLRTVFNDTLVQAAPRSAVTFVVNHKTPPIVDLVMKPWFKLLAYALILLREGGYPCLFYGDLFGIGGGVENGGQGPIAPVRLPVLTMARKVFAYGEQNDYFDDKHVLGWVRRGTWDCPNGLAVVMSNSDAGEKRMFVGKLHRNEVWVDMMVQIDQEVVIGDDGWGNFACRSRSIFGVEAINYILSGRRCRADHFGRIDVRSDSNEPAVRWASDVA